MPCTVSHKESFQSARRKGDLGSAVGQLEQYVEVAERAGPRALARACGAIGTMHNTLVSHPTPLHTHTHTHTLGHHVMPSTHTQGDYGKSVEFFGRCYELCTQLDDPAALHEARVQYGIARGHQLFQNYTATVSACSGGQLERLIAWKDERANVEERAEATEVAGTTASSDQEEEEKDGEGEEGGEVEDTQPHSEQTP